MSLIVDTPLGRFREVIRDGIPEWLWECRCGEWGPLDSDQWHGLISVDHASMGCAANYHETHDYAQALEAALP